MKGGGGGGVERKFEHFRFAISYSSQLSFFSSHFFNLCQDWLNTFEDPDLKAAAADPDKWKDIMRENARLMYGSADDKEKDEL
jgi:hypothetical protein